MATHSSVLAWRILGTGEPGGLPSMGSHNPWVGKVPGEGNGSPLPYSSWRIPWTEEPDGIQSMGLKESDKT